MATILGDPYPPTWSGRPPHMSTEDYAIWQRWREKAFVMLAQRVYFDVALETQEPIPDVPEAISRGWQRLTAQRIDVVLEYPAGWYICEIRYGASASAIGRLLGYLTLWQESPPDHRKVHLILVTDRPAPGLATLAKKQGVLLEIV